MKIITWIEIILTWYKDAIEKEYIKYKINKNNIILCKMLLLTCIYICILM